MKAQLVKISVSELRAIRNRMRAGKCKFRTGIRKLFNELNDDNN